jgi:hypothetical protein
MVDHREDVRCGARKRVSEVRRKASAESLARYLTHPAKGRSLSVHVLRLLLLRCLMPDISAQKRSALYCAYGASCTSPTTSSFPYRMCEYTLHDPQRNLSISGRRSALTMEGCLVTAGSDAPVTTHLISSIHGCESGKWVLCMSGGN